jgi:hypothetical protein
VDVLIKEMEMQLKRIINDNGYSEMADGFEQAMDIVKCHKETIETIEEKVVLALSSLHEHCSISHERN